MSDTTDKLISAAELIAYASRFSVWGWSTEDQEKFLDNVLWCIYSTPPVANNIDIRCRNCKHGQIIDGTAIWCKCLKKNVSENFFCGFGEQKGEEIC